MGYLVWRPIGLRGCHQSQRFLKFPNLRRSGKGPILAGAGLPYKKRSSNLPDRWMGFSF